MKLSLRQKIWIIRGVLGIAMVLLFLILVVDGGLPELFKYLVIGGIIVGLTLNLCWWRCPACRRFMGRDGGEYCPYCGKKIDFDAK